MAGSFASASFAQDSALSSSAFDFGISTGPQGGVSGYLGRFIKGGSGILHRIERDVAQQKSEFAADAARAEAHAREVARYNEEALTHILSHFFDD